MSDSTDGSSKKDLTSITEYPAAESSDTQSNTQPTAPTETIEEFESLETLSQSQLGTQTEHEPTLSGIPGISSEMIEDPEPQIESQRESASSETLILSDDAPVLDKVKQFSEQMPSAPGQIADPFSVLILGQMAPEEREKLLDILSRHEIGVREVDLEPQFASGKVLIPRISEYAGILIVQALRGASVEIRLGPSDQIFSTETTRAETVSIPTISSPEIPIDLSHPAEHLPITTDSSLPELPKYTIIDTLISTATLQSKVVEAEKSSEYLEIIDNLKRELRYKAYRKGAAAVIRFAVQLTPLGIPTQYRLTAIGIAVRASQGKKDGSREVTWDKTV